MKTCTGCNKEKPRSEFWKSSKSPDGLLWKCIECCKSLWRDRTNRYSTGGKALDRGRKPRPVPIGKRWCGACKTPLDLGMFTGDQRTCRSCKRERHRLRAYGLTQSQFRDLERRAGGLCEACREKPWSYVDHCHSTGMVRGLLCPGCNTLAQDITKLKMIITYVQTAIATNE